MSTDNKTRHQDLDDNKSSYTFEYYTRIDDIAGTTRSDVCKACERRITPFDKEPLYYGLLNGKTALFHLTCFATRILIACKICRQIVTPYNIDQDAFFSSSRICVHRKSDIHNRRIDTT
jgi:hypothetical protein